MPLIEIFPLYRSWEGKLTTVRNIQLVSKLQFQRIQLARRLLLIFSIKEGRRIKFLYSRLSSCMCTFMHTLVQLNVNYSYENHLLFFIWANIIVKCYFDKQ